jgi:hypothetical protein
VEREYYDRDCSDLALMRSIRRTDKEWFDCDIVIDYGRIARLRIQYTQRQLEYA